MKFNTFLKFFSFFLILLVASPGAGLSAQNKKFVVVLDAGHGGHDPGAVGKITREKNITLDVVLKLGQLIEKNMSDVRVIYTRKTDVFIPLEQRAMTANNNQASLFISIHVNSAQSKSAYGTETFTLGLAKTKANLDVAMTENSVMLLEDDYKTKYKGFDPSSVESYIMFEFMMDQYLDKSIEFATSVQNQFVNGARRYDRGVRQAGFWVLHRSACPSVLIELGFISNYKEELYLASNEGQHALAKSVYNAFVDYKKDYDKKLGYLNGNSRDYKKESVETDARKEPDSVASEKNIAVSEPAGTVKDSVNVPLFKIQIISSASALNPESSRFKNVGAVGFFKEGGLFKYTVGSESDYDKISDMCKDVRKKFPDAFVIAFMGDKKISISEALKYKK